MRLNICLFTIVVTMACVLLLPPVAYLQSLGAREANTSLNGTRLTYYQQPSVDRCQADCANNPSCKGFTWIQAGTYNASDPAMCYLLSAVTTRASARGHISAVKEAADGGGTLSARVLNGRWHLLHCDSRYAAYMTLWSKDGATFEGTLEAGQGEVKNGQLRGNTITFDRVLAPGQTQHHSAQVVNNGGRLKMQGSWTGAYQENCPGRTNWQAEKQ